MFAEIVPCGIRCLEAELFLSRRDIGRHERGRKGCAGHRLAVARYRRLNTDTWCGKVDVVACLAELSAALEPVDRRHGNHGFIGARIAFLLRERTPVTGGRDHDRAKLRRIVDRLCDERVLIAADTDN